MAAIIDFFSRSKLSSCQTIWW